MRVTSGDVGLHVEHEQRVVQAGAQQHPAAAAGPLVNAHAPALVVLGLQRPAARAARPTQHPVMERRQHARALRLVVRVLQSISTSAS